MNTQNVNVKTATKNHSERYGKNPSETVLDLGCSTLTLIELVGIESQLMQQKSLLAIGAIEPANIDLEVIGDTVMEIDTMINEGAIFTKNAYDVVCSINSLTIMLTSLVNKGWMPYSIPALDELKEAAAVLQAEAVKTAAEELKPYRVFATGVTEYPEDDWRLGTYYRDETTRVCCVNSIQEAVAAAKTACSTAEWNIRDAGRDYYDRNLGHDCGPISFSARTVTIKDRKGQKVLAGEVLGGDIYWQAPATDEQIENNVDVLRILEEQRLEEFEEDLEAQVAIREEEFH